MRLTSLILSLGLPMVLLACGDAHPGHGHVDAHGATASHHAFSPEKHAAKLQTKLELTDAQTASIRAVFESGGEKDELHEKINAVLTPEQRTRFDRMVAKHARGGGFGKHGRRDPAARAAKLTKKLSLTAEQSTQVEAVYTDFQPQMEALHETMKAAHADGAEKLDPKALHAQFKELKTARTARLQTILTPEQFQAYTAIKSRHHGGPGGPGGADQSTCANAGESCAHGAESCAQAEGDCPAGQDCKQP